MLKQLMLNLQSENISKPQYLGRSVSLVAIAFIGMLIGTILSVFVPYPTEYLSLAGRVIISQGIGLAGTSLLYIHLTGKTLDFFQFNFKPRRDVGIAVGVALSLLSLSMIVSIITTTAGVETAQNSVTPVLESSTANVYTFIFLSMFVVGPLEELFFRGTIQRHLRQGFRTRTAVGITAILFSIIHLMSMIGNVSPLGYLAYLIMLFAGGFLLGYSYELTDNLFIPMAGHGLYNAILGATLLF